MPIKNKSVKQVVKDELLDKSHISDRVVRIYICNQDNIPQVLKVEKKVRNENDWEDMKASWKDECVTLDYINKVICAKAKKPFVLSMRIIERDTNGAEFNPLGDNVSILLHKTNFKTH